MRPSPHTCVGLAPNAQCPPSHSPDPKPSAAAVLGPHCVQNPRAVCRLDCKAKAGGGVTGDRSEAAPRKHRRWGGAEDISDPPCSLLAIATSGSRTLAHTSVELNDSPLLMLSYRHLVLSSPTTWLSSPDPISHGPSRANSSESLLRVGHCAVRFA